MTSPITRERPAPSPTVRGVRVHGSDPASRLTRRVVDIGGQNGSTVIRMTITETPARGGTVRGSLAPPRVDALNVADVLAEIEAREFTSLPRLGDQIGMGEQSRKYAIREGLIKPEPLALGRRYEGYKVNRDEAITLLLAAALAIAAGVAIAVMLRGVRNSGLTGAAAEVALRAMTT